MKVIILCGGDGIKLEGDSTPIPKALAKIGNKPIIWHTMKRYALFGHNEFILALGYKGDAIRDYFTNYEKYTNDICLTLSKPEQYQSLSENQESDWKITFVDTGYFAKTGARIFRCKKYFENENEFIVGNAECLSNINLEKLIRFHRKMKKVATVVGVAPPLSDTELLIQNNLAVDFSDNIKRTNKDSRRFISGGSMIFNMEILSYLAPYNECVLEKEIFKKLIKQKQLAVISHFGFWRWLGTSKDHKYLNELVNENKMYWLRQ